MSEITVKLNKPLVEIEKQGFRIFRYGPALQIGGVTASATDNVKGGKTGVQAWTQADDRNFIRNPGTGAIQVRPSGMRDDFFESAAFASGKFDSTDWNYNTGQWEIIDFSSYTNQSGSLKGFHPKLATETTDLTAWSPGTPFTDYTTSIETSMVWTHELKTAIPKNAGFGFIVQPNGVAWNRPKTIMSIGFGTRYILELKTNGVAQLYAYLVNSWVVISTFDYATAGVKPNEPFQVNIIPNSYAFISFYFSQYSQTTKVAGSTSGKDTKKETSFTVDLRRYYTVSFDNTKGTSNTVPAGKIVVGFRKGTFRVTWSAYRNIYDTSVDYACAFRPETLPHRLDHAQAYNSGGTYALQLNTFGFESNQSGTDLHTKNRLTITATATNGTGSWSNTDKVVPVKVDFYPSTLYSPELWGYRVLIPEKTHTPSWTPEDISDKWTKINFKNSLEHDPQSAEIKAINSDQTKLFKQYGPVEIKAKGKVIWDGYVTNRKPVIEGGYLLMSDMFQCLDVSVRFTETPAGFDSIAGLTVRNAIERLINQCGIPSSQIEYHEDDDWTNYTTIEMPEGQNQDKLWKADTTVAEALNSIFDLYSVQGQDKLALVRKDGKYHLVSSVDYSIAKDQPGYEQPKTRFWSTQPNVTGTTDAERWGEVDGVWTDADRDFKVFSPFEFSIAPTPFNTVRVTVGKETSDNSSGIQSASIFDVDGSVTDPNNDQFVGRFIQKTADTPKSFQVTTLKEAERYARTLLQFFNKKRILCSWHGEWQPGVYAGDIVSLVGAIKTTEDEYKIVSFGAYKLLEVNVEITSDTDENDEFGKTDFTWIADYSAQYYGPSEYSTGDIILVDIPYFNPGHDGSEVS